MKIFVRNLLHGAGIAALFFFPEYQPALFNQHPAFLHTPLPLTCFALATIANLILTALLLALALTWMQATPLGLCAQVYAPAVWAIAAYWIASILSRSAFHLRVFIVFCACALLAMWCVYRFRPALYRQIQAVISAAYVGLAVFCFFVFVQLLCIALWRPPAHSLASVVVARAPDHAARPRVVWILMDELAYAQVFAQRAPGLSLPNFDAFRRVSTLFTDVQPVATYTELAVPSLLEGRQVQRIKYTFSNRLLLAFPGEPFSPFQAAETPFALAKRANRTTGVVGWYNPYCSMLAPFLDACYWTYTTTSLGSPVTPEAFRMFLVKPWKDGESVFRPQGQRPDIERQRDDFVNLDRRAQTMAGDDRFDFIFLHLPLPHPPGFYSRRTGQFDISGRASYLDNLALADKTLGELLAILRASPRWSTTSVVLCGDHSWRTNQWRNSVLWTPEDNAASHGGVFDPRPMLMVHRAGQMAPETIDQPVPLLEIHAILDALLQLHPAR